jgi:pteridine reductase
VTGGAVRVGLEIARGLADAGARGGGHLRSAEAARAAVRDPQARGVRAVARGGPGRLREARACGVAVRRLGRLDILVNNAALFVRTPVLTTTPAQFDRLLAVNLRAPFFVSQAAARAMGRRGGRIINIADVGAVRAWAGYVPYGISKAGVVMLTRGLAVALAPRIQVNAVAPGVVLLPEGFPRQSGRRLAARIPMGRHGRPADVAEAVRFFATCSDYITGQVLFVDGGASLVVRREEGAGRLRDTLTCRALSRATMGGSRFAFAQHGPGGRPAPSSHGGRGPTQAYTSRRSAAGRGDVGVWAQGSPSV